MKTTLLAVGLLFTGLQLAHAQAKLPNPTASLPFTKEEQQLLDLSKTKWTWMANKNATALDGLFKGELRFCAHGRQLGEKSGAEHH